MQLLVNVPDVAVHGVVDDTLVVGGEVLEAYSCANDAQAKPISKAAPTVRRSTPICAK